MTWTCVACTFQNTQSLALVCEMCETVRVWISPEVAFTPQDELNSGSNNLNNLNNSNTLQPTRPQLEAERLARQKRSSEMDLEFDCSNSSDELGSKKPKTAVQGKMNPGIQKGERIYWNKISPIGEFIETFKPNVVTVYQAHWIQVEHPGYTPMTKDHMPTARDFATLSYDSIKARCSNQISETKRITAAQKQKAIEDILALATVKGDTCGKWMVFTDDYNVGRVWSLICTATAKGELGHTAKVATKNPAGNSSNYLICVYCPDFNDVNTLELVLRRLKELGISVTTGFKPDVFTAIGLYSGNEWRLPTTIHEAILRTVFPK
ncbi:hypothetical protein BDR26DRAFT_871779 [Obelidium mucronatum]|nr:hypothetical protein BDR26DRAFT_871779 [Obelidium mucronatum]